MAKITAILKIMEVDDPVIVAISSRDPTIVLPVSLDKFPSPPQPGQTWSASLVLDDNTNEIEVDIEAPARASRFPTVMPRPSAPTRIPQDIGKPQPRRRYRGGSAAMVIEDVSAC
jgi:hypothetical protein